MKKQMHHIPGSKGDRRKTRKGKFWLCPERDELDRVSTLLKADKNEKARSILFGLNLDDNFYVNHLLSISYFQDDDIEKAHKHAAVALKKAPTDPDILWHMGRVQRAAGDSDLAIDFFNYIIWRGAQAFVKGTHQYDIDTTQSIVLDSKFELARIYDELGQKDKKMYYLKLFLKGYKKGMDTLFEDFRQYIDLADDEEAWVDAFLADPSGWPSRD